MANDSRKRPAGAPPAAPPGDDLKLPALPPLPDPDPAKKRPYVPLADVLQAKRTRGTAGKKLAVALALAAGIAASVGAGYLYGRAEQVKKLQELRRELGLDKPVKTEGFVLTGPDTLALTAEVNTRSIRRVVFSPLPGVEEELYKADRPGDGFTTVHAKRKYDLADRRGERRVTAAVTFVPFDDLPAELLAGVSLTAKREVLLSPILGVVLDPGDEPVRLEVPPEVTAPDGRVEVGGVSLRDGYLVLLTRPAGAGAWRVQELGRHLRVRAGQHFAVPCALGTTDGQAEVVAVVVPSAEDSPFTKAEVAAIPTADPKGRPLERTRPAAARARYSDPERQAAERLLKLGCRLSVEKEGKNYVDDVRDLPADRAFFVTQVYAFKRLVGEEELRLLGRLRKLNQLDASASRVDDAGLAHLAGLTTLKVLRLEDCRVTDTGAAHLKGLVALETLDLGRTGVTDAGLAHLTGLKKLKSLNLSGTKVTDEGVAKLNAELPGCQIRR